MLHRFFRRKKDSSADQRLSEKSLTMHLRNYGFAPDHVIDVGVHDGTPYLYDAFPESNLILVDPRRECLNSVSEIIGDRVFEFHCVALSDSFGQATLTIPTTSPGRGAAMSSLRERIDPLSKTFTNIEKRKVPLVTLDSILQAHDGSVGLKIDTEGAELEVLRGAKKTLDRAQFVVLELSVVARFAGEPEPSKIIDILARYGLEFRDVLGKSSILDENSNCAPRYFDCLFARWKE